ncbi:branched-chain amino acid transport system II carrier protein [Desulfoluna butyratoxydans]|uniref:Branched-chain amino acid transport system ii carrier protein n=1 Tax=Desulfoluna butyratoxydans TaxID=231438 RepID=A0A4U8YR66_9BACT|nr:branched-chain amino acid transport system II carrier protein [Desulfoluna butyratoxydans]VFQ46835.1 branched-chain amino acid transport system ii carrier protein [Desulfoluna butyratoxydans]
MNKEMKDIVVAGAALFAMFFGAGNLIFPPALGFLSGTSWFFCMLGFFITGVGLPILGVAALAKSGGSLDRFAGRVSPVFAKVMGTAIVLAIGPFLAIPRTGATVYEIGIKPLFSGVSPLTASVAFFVVTLFFALKPSSIVDKIGKYLTPVLLLIIGLIIVKGVASPIGHPVAKGLTQPLGRGFIEGYQTMDALASILFAGLVLSAIAAKGYKTAEEQISLTCKAGLIAGTGLMLVYGGLLFLGATGSGMFEEGISKSDLIVSITNTVLGSAGRTAMCLAVSAACLTTAIGLTAVVGSWFEKLSHGKLKYESVVIITAIFSTLISVSGVEKIVTFSVPLLIIAYPIVIVLIALTLWGSKLSSAVYKGAVAGCLIVSVFDALSFLKVDTGAAGKLIAKLPFADAGFSWVLPAIFCAVVMELIRTTMHHKPLNQSTMPKS